MRNAADISTVTSAAVIAAVAVVRSQNSPSRNITQMPGVTKPVKSWMYWKPCWKLLRKGLVMTMAMRIATIATMRPTLTSVCCSVCGRAARYRSIVKMVAIELILDPVEATMAATSAANTRPLMPMGNIAMRLGYAWSVCSEPRHQHQRRDARHHDDRRHDAA